MAIVDFAGAMRMATDYAKDRERQRMMSLLPNPQKHTKDGDHTASYLNVYPEAGSTPGIGEIPISFDHPVKKTKEAQSEDLRALSLLVPIT